MDYTEIETDIYDYDPRHGKSRFDGAEYWRPHKLRRSTRFIPGERIGDTLLTVIGPGFKDRWGTQSWQEVDCLCDQRWGGCGNTIKVKYVFVYRYPQKYSCGCRQRRRWNETDHTGLSVTGYQTGRKLTILFLDDTRGEWLYVCECCGNTGYVPRGMGQTTPMKLKAAARIPCPSLPVYYSLEQLPDIERHVQLNTKTRIDADLIEQLNSAYPGCKLVYGGYESRICGIETNLKPNSKPKPVESTDSSLIGS